MPTSQNGYTVIQRQDCVFYDDIVVGLDLPMRPDDCGYVLADFLRKFNTRVEPLGRTETFCHALRQIAGTEEWSNHASATAVDANSNQHQQGKTGTFSDAEEEELTRLVTEYDGVIRWGGTFRTTPDEMHFEIVRPYDEVHTLARVIRRNDVVKLSRLEFGNRNLDVYMVKRRLKQMGFFTGEVTNYFGKGLIRAYANFQQSLGYTGSDADGMPGTVSLERMGFEVR